MGIIAQPSPEMPDILRIYYACNLACADDSIDGALMRLARHARPKCFEILSDA